MSSGLEAVDNESTSAYRGGVAAFNRSTGKELWRTYTVEPPFNGATVWSTVAIDPELGLVYGATGNNYTGEGSDTSDSIFALRLRDGKVAWLTQLSKGDVFTIIHQLSPDSDFGTNPMLFEARINGLPRKLVGAGQKSGSFWALDRRTGAVVWSQKISDGSSLGGGMLNNGAFDGKHILVAGDRATSDAPGGEPSNDDTVGIFPPNTSVLKALDPGTGAVVWERQLPAWVWAPITVANGVGFVAYETQLQAFDVNTGKKLFNYKTGGTISSAPVAVDGAVYFGSGITYIGTHPDHTFHALAVDGVRVGGDFPDAGTDAEPPADAPSGPSFTKVYQDLIVSSGCASAFCHGGSAGNLAMTTEAEAYQALVGVTAAGPLCGSSGTKRVDPGHPESSLLLDKIANAAPACGTVMPPGASVSVSAEVVGEVRDWIAAGASGP
jgi:outer membrane protein assembly factor BamB